MKIAKKIMVYTKPGHSIEPIVHHSKECLKLLFAQIQNLKHQSLLTLTYSGELRPSKKLNLKVKDVDYTYIQYEYASKNKYLLQKYSL